MVEPVHAREMMELFSLGADSGAYTETDIREAARALTGWRNDWSNELGAHNFRFDPKRWDSGAKTIFEYAPISHGAADYNRVVDWLLHNTASTEATLHSEPQVAV